MTENKRLPTDQEIGLMVRAVCVHKWAAAQGHHSRHGFVVLAIKMARILLPHPYSNSQLLDWVYGAIYGDRLLRLADQPLLDQLFAKVQLPAGSSPEAYQEYLKQTLDQRSGESILMDLVFRRLYQRFHGQPVF